MSQRPLQVGDTVKLIHAGGVYRTLLKRILGTTGRVMSVEDGYVILDTPPIISIDKKDVILVEEVVDTNAPNIGEFQGYPIVYMHIVARVGNRFDFYWSNRRLNRNFYFLIVAKADKFIIYQVVKDHSRPTKTQPKFCRQEYSSLQAAKDVLTQW